jgi:hypothetical protein
MNRMTKKPWFGPKEHDGWGWRVSSWQGVVIVAIFIVFVFIDSSVFKFSLKGIIGYAILLAGFLLIAYLTGDQPGGPLG